jgi:hypothetical protein
MKQVVVRGTQKGVTQGAPVVVIIVTPARAQVRNGSDDSSLQFGFCTAQGTLLRLALEAISISTLEKERAEAQAVAALEKYAPGFDWVAVTP